MAGAGAVYGFSSYAPDIKTKLNWDQGQIEFVGSMFNVGLYIGPVHGILTQVFKKSPYINFAISGIFAALGYFFTGFVLGRDVSEGNSPGTGLYALLFIFAGFGSGLSYVTAIAVCVQNVSNSPKLKGKIGVFMGFLVSSFGFGAIIFSSIDKAIGSTVLFLKYMGLIMLLLGVLGCVFVRVIDFSSDLESQNLIKKTEDENVDQIPSLKERIVTVFQCIFRVGKLYAFWIIFIAFMFGSGNGLMYTTNLGNLSQSIDNRESSKEEIQKFTVQCIIIYSIANGLGRIVMGFSDYLPLKRSYFLAISLACMTISQILCAFLIKNLSIIRYASGIVGFSYGLLWSITPTILSEDIWSSRVWIDLGMDFISSNIWIVII
jgi:hypothetical protein